MRALRGNLTALGIFAAAFALHIVGGATDQGWLFALAVVLIFATAVLFPVIVKIAAGKTSGREQSYGLVAGLIAGATLTTGALWAANDRTLAWWQPLVAAVLVGVGAAAASRVPLSRVLVRSGGQTAR